MKQPLYKQLASRLTAYCNCLKAGNCTPWEDTHKEAIESLVNAYLPSGSGFDVGTKFEFEMSRPNRLVFSTSFHHMDEHGYYNGWTSHNVVVVPDLQSDFVLRITGTDRNQIKDYIHSCFEISLRESV